MSPPGRILRLRILDEAGVVPEVGEVPEVGVGPRGRGGPKRNRRFEVREVSLMEVVTLRLCVETPTWVSCLFSKTHEQ